MWAIQIQVLRFHYPSEHAAMSDLLRGPYVLPRINRGLKTKQAATQGLQINVASKSANHQPGQSEKS